MKMLKAILMMATMAMSMSIAIATNYTVGGPNGGWNQATDYQTWASSVTFIVGDSLLFQYTPNHDVTEVSKTDFDACNPNNPLQPPSSGGTTLIQLTTAGTRYFICATPGHCMNGMKIQIDTITASTPPPSLPPPSPVTVPSAPPPSTITVPPPTSNPSIPSPPPASHPVSSPPPKTVISSPPPKKSPTMPPVSSPRASVLAPPEVSPTPSTRTPASSASIVNLISALTAGLCAMVIMFLNL